MIFRILPTGPLSVLPQLPTGSSCWLCLQDLWSPTSEPGSSIPLARSRAHLCQQSYPCSKAPFMSIFFLRERSGQTLLPLPSGGTLHCVCSRRLVVTLHASFQEAQTRAILFPSRGPVTVGGGVQSHLSGIFSHPSRCTQSFPLPLDLHPSLLRVSSFHHVA